LMAALPDAIPLNRADLELTDPASVEQALRELAPNLVINTAAYNLVDQAEDHPELAFAVNRHGPASLARWCAKQDAVLVQISTDYVFGGDPGQRSPLVESDRPLPVSVYGSSKFAGEEAVKQLCPQHFIIRTCGLYGRAATKTKGNFVNTMLRLADERPELRVVHDQYCTPTYTQDVAAQIALLVRKGGSHQFGTYHVTNAGKPSWFDVATEALRLAGKSTPVLPISTEEYPTRALRPAYSVLNCDKIQSVTGQKIPHWEDALARYLKEIQVT